MKKIKKLFGEINLTWPKIIIFAVIVGIYTAIMSLIPTLKHTSFHDIAVTFEIWILFGIIIIMNSSKPKESALKCFVFFLISQPLVYLIQVPFSGYAIFRYYGYWFIWTILTLPMGYIGYYMKKNKWWSLLILLPILILLGVLYYDYLRIMIYNFPYHIITILFCLITLLLYPICIYNNKLKNIGLIISIIIIIISTSLAFLNKYSYNTTILINNDSYNISFDDSYNVYLQDNSFGKVYIEYEDAIEEYVINAKFIKSGKTKLVLEDNEGKKELFEIKIYYDSFDLNYLE